MERKYIIYQHTTPSGKVYIGQTCQENPNVRWANGKGYKECTLFYNSIKKYGWDNIVHNILHTGLTKEKADILEKMYIRFFKRKNISLNIADGGEGGPLSAAHRQKISEANKGKVRTEETRRQMSESHKGMPFSAEHRRKLSELHKGKVLTDEHRRKISETEKGKPKGPLSAEARQKLSEANKVKTLSAEHRRKISEAEKGKIVSEETRRKISEATKGRPKKRSIWLNEFSQEIEMADCCVAHYHPNWVKVRDL